MRVHAGGVRDVTASGSGLRTDRDQDQADVCHLSSSASLAALHCSEAIAVAMSRG